MDHQTTDCTIRHRSRYAIQSLPTLLPILLPFSIHPRKASTDMTVTGFVYYASYNYFSSTYFPNLPIQGKCAGEEFAAFAGIGILSSYLLLFISFYLATYKKSAAAKGRKRSMSEMGKKAAIDMSKLEVPTVEEAIHVGSPIKEKENGSANGSMNGRATRSRRA